MCFIICYTEWVELSTVLIACLTFASEKLSLLFEIWWERRMQVTTFVWLSGLILTLSFSVFALCLASSGNGECMFILYRNKPVKIMQSTFKLCYCLWQSLVQNSRKAGITSAMASTTLGNEELVGFPSHVRIHRGWITDITLTRLCSVPSAEKSRL